MHGTAPSSVDSADRAADPFIESEPRLPLYAVRCAFCPFRSGQRASFSPLAVETCLVGETLIRCKGCLTGVV